MKDSDLEEEGRSSRPSVRELEVLHAVITTRKTTAAAQRLGVSQPAVSRAIGALEARLGRDLFIRDGGRLVPTADAFALDAEAAPIFAALARLEHWPNTPPMGNALRIAATTSLAHAFLSPLIVRFLQAEPETRLKVEIGHAEDAVRAVADGQADLGVVDLTGTYPGVRLEPFRQATAHVMMRTDHPLAGRDRISPQDLEGVAQVALTKRVATRARIDRIFADQGVEPRILMEAGTLQFLTDFVRTGLGVAVVNPFPVAYVTGAGITFRPFTPEVEFESCFLFPATGGHLPVARRFVDFVRQEQMNLVPAS